jgi:hypothetical protein
MHSKCHPIEVSGGMMPVFTCLGVSSLGLVLTGALVFGNRMPKRKFCIQYSIQNAKTGPENEFKKRNAGSCWKSKVHRPYGNCVALAVGRRQDENPARTATPSI